MIKKIFFPAVFFIVLSACASPRAVIKQDYDFSSVKTVRVGNFISETEYSNSGSSVQSAFIRQLLAKGYRVKVDANTQADVFIEGSVTSYVPDKKYLVRLAEEDRRHGRHAVYAGDITEISGSTMYDLGSAFGLGEPNKIMASNATVGIYAYMVDSDTDEIVWSDSYTYEGLDISSALEGAVKYILRSLPRTSLSQ
ncbi:MAG: hypothetical protein FWH43_02950 [Endomicrobia bacterium]|nr:hypothetical protein [Endomicrobiia bacterium]